MNPEIKKRILALGAAGTAALVLGGILSNGSSSEVQAPTQTSLIEPSASQTPDITRRNLSSHILLSTPEIKKTQFPHSGVGGETLHHLGHTISESSEVIIFSAVALAAVLGIGAERQRQPHK